MLFGINRVEPEQKKNVGKYIFFVCGAAKRLPESIKKKYYGNRQSSCLPLHEMNAKVNGNDLMLARAAFVGGISAFRETNSLLCRSPLFQCTCRRYCRGILLCNVNAVCEHTHTQYGTHEHKTLFVLCSAECVVAFLSLMSL